MSNDERFDRIEATQAKILAAIEKINATFQKPWPGTVSHVPIVEPGVIYRVIAGVYTKSYDNHAEPPVVENVVLLLDRTAADGSRIRLVDGLDGDDDDLIERAFEEEPNLWTASACYGEAEEQEKRMTLGEAAIKNYWSSYLPWAKVIRDISVADTDDSYSITSTFKIYELKSPSSVS